MKIMFSFVYGKLCNNKNLMKNLDIKRFIVDFIKMKYFIFYIKV